MANARGQARRSKPVPQLEFWHALAQRMLFNNLDDDGRTVAQVERPKTQQAVEKLSNEHRHKKRPFFTGEWGDKKGTWGTAKD